MGERGAGDSSHEDVTDEPEVVVQAGLASGTAQAGPDENEEQG